MAQRHFQPMWIFLFAVLAFTQTASWTFAADDTADKPAAGDSATKEKDAKQNPYLPRKGMPVEDLKAYIERMQEAPASIRDRPGFAEGMAVAAQRILDTNPQGSLRTFAVLTLLDSLHQWADVEESQKADDQLAELVKKYADDSDKKIADAAAFYAFEQRVLKAENLDNDKITALLDEIKKSLTGKQLDAKYLRLASATVKLINKIKDDNVATARFKEFGELVCHQQRSRFIALREKTRSHWQSRRCALRLGWQADGTQRDDGRRGQVRFRAVQRQSGVGRLLGHLVRPLPRGVAGTQRNVRKIPQGRFRSGRSRFGPATERS